MTFIFISFHGNMVCMAPLLEDMRLDPHQRWNLKRDAVVPGGMKVV